MPGTSMSRLNIYPYIIVLHCYPPRPPGLDVQGEGLRGAVGLSGVVHKLLWRGCGSTRVGLPNVGGGSRDPVTRCWECARRGGQTSAGKLLPFFLLSVFLRGDI